MPPCPSTTGFWLADCLALLGLANDVSLFSEEFDRYGRQDGNLPQAVTHVALINTARNLTETKNERHGIIDKRARSASCAFTASASRKPPVHGPVLLPGPTPSAVGRD
jgi:hypothetical protein